ncbi:MAG: alanine racemase [Pseudomonadota bacterium]|nr:alanine racemase [Pseudomonadota bacterium]
MTRPVWAEVDRSALRHNLKVARRLGQGRQVVAAVKANAYGHGLAEVARALAPDTDLLGVAALDEACELRAAGVEAPVLLFEGPFDADEIEPADRLGCELCVHSSWQLQLLESVAPRRPQRLWIKLDTGMHRLGFAPEQASELARTLARWPWVKQLVWTTHLAQADTPERGYTQRQLAAFHGAVASLPGQSSIFASAGILSAPTQGPADHYVRPGIMLYGATPFRASTGALWGLRPAMRLCSRIIAVRTLGAGEPVGYGGDFVTARPSRIAVVAAGYGDGYPRHAPSGTPVGVAGRTAVLVGRVSMDMLTIDITDLPWVDRGAEVELWGPQVPAERLAQGAGTIPYALFTGVTRRVAVRYK